MGRKYDAIVIGAGLGGLSAATMLARNGLSVLLLERHNVPGGYATSFVRGRYEFEVALHELSGIGPTERRGGLYRYLEYLGVTNKVDFLILPNLYRSVFPDIDITLPAGDQEFKDALCATFPEQADGINRFMKRIFDLGRDYSKFIRKGGRVNPIKMPFQHPHFFRYLPTTWGQILNRDISDPRLRGVLSQYWGYVGMPPSQISFLYFAMTMASYIRRGPAFPKGRSQALSNAFMDTFEELGGEAKFNCGVKKILTENDRASGVITEQEQEIHADWIISNADPVTTCHEMIGAKNTPSEFFRRLQSSEIAASTVNVYMGVAQPHKKLGLDEHEVFINSDYNFERHYQAMHTLEAPPAMAVTCYNVVYPDISPPGTSVVVLTSLAFGKPWYQVSPAAYVDTKNRLAEAMIQMAEKVAPDLRKYTEVIEVSTPVTNIRYAGTLGGSIYGFNQPPRDNMVWRLGTKGPVSGLYFVGAWVQPGGGFELSIMSGQIAGSAVTRQIKKRREGILNGN
jgi:phytoene dehydrogenase-like protein